MPEEENVFGLVDIIWTLDFVVFTVSHSFGRLHYGLETFGLIWQLRCHTR